MEYCTIGIFAHANAGKTTVTENILYRTGIIDNIGRVDLGTTITDNMLVERKRGITIRSSYVTFNVKNLTVQLLDTPGHVDFSAEVVRAMSVLDAAIFVISGVEGIEAQTVNIWNMLKQMNIPTIFFVNKLDRIGASYDRTVESLKTIFTAKLVNLQNILLDGSNIAIERKNSEEILEQMAEFDDVCFNIYFDENRDINMDWINNRIKSLYKSRDIFCVLGGSALSEIGIDELLECIVDFLPHFEKCNDDPFAGVVYMIKQNNGLKEAFVKVIRGTIENRMSILFNDKNQKVRTLTCINGNKKVPCDLAYSGQLVIITGIDCYAGEWIGETEGIECFPISVSPMFTAVLSIEDEEKKNYLWNAIRELNEEDPVLDARLDNNTQNIQIDLMGRLQGETIVQMLSERYQIEANLSEPSIIYKETPIKEGIGKAGYTKTSNVALKIEPLPRGSGIVYQSLLASDYLFTKYQKQVERLVNKYSDIGLYGWKITDCRISLIGGKCDNVGSEPHDYSIAAPIAFARALQAAGTKLLEPIVSYTVTCPIEYYPDVLGRLMGLRKGYNEIIEKDDGNYEILGTAFLSEIEVFVNLLREITGGKGTANYIHIGYDDALLNSYIKRPILEANPHNEAKFVLQLSGVMENLDKGLETKRGKPEKIKRNKHLWKKQ